MRYLLAALAASTSLCASSANAAIAINFSEVGSDVVASLSGSFNTDGLQSSRVGTLENAGISPRNNVVTFGVFGAVSNIYDVLSGPSSFGAGSFRNATSSSGDVAGLLTGQLVLPRNYVSGSALAATSLFANQTLVTLGLTAGEYVYASSNDTLTLTVRAQQQAAVPEPATWGMMILGFGIVGAAARRRRTTSVVAY